jgi:predicted lipid-binding transport protein (Tim44 family)
MSTTHQNKPGGKPGQRSRKKEPRSPKPDQQQGPKLDQQDAKEQNDATVASTDASTNGAAALADAPSISAVAPADISPIGAVALADAPSIGAVAPADNFPVSIQTIASAYGDYSRKSFEQTKSFVEKLSGARSLDKVIEIQTEFAKQAYETFVAESQKIRELYSGLAKQTFKPFEGLVARATPGAR